MHTVLRGCRFRPMDAQVCVLQLQVGDFLLLEPEPTNQYDPNAIKVLATNSEGVKHFIGYVAKEDCEDVLGMLQTGRVKATIASENGYAPAIEIEYDFGEEEADEEDPE